MIRKTYFVIKLLYFLYNFNLFSRSFSKKNLFSRLLHHSIWFPFWLVFLWFFQQSYDINSPVRYKLVIWKLLPCFQNRGDFSQPNQTSSATNTFSKHSNLFLQNGLQSFFFFSKIYSQSFLTFYYYWCLEVSPKSIYCLVFVQE